MLGPLEMYGGIVLVSWNRIGWLDRLLKLNLFEDRFEERFLCIKICTNDVAQSHD